MSRKTDQTKQNVKLKKILLQQHDRIGWANRVIKALAEHKSKVVREATKAVIADINYTPDILKLREEDLQEIRDIFVVDDLIVETKIINGADRREAMTRDE